MLAFSIRSEDYSRIREPKPKGRKHSTNASGFVLCSVLFVLTYGLTDAYLEANAPNHAMPKSKSDPFLIISKDMRSKLRGTTAHFEFVDAIQTGSTIGNIVHDQEENSEIIVRSGPNLHDRPSTGFEFGYPAKLVHPDLHVR